MEEFLELILKIADPKTICLLCGVCIFTDVLSGYIKAIKNKKLNSSVSRDGYIKKMGWVMAIIFGFIMDTLVGLNIFLVGTGIVCIATEGISVYENFAEVGVPLPFKKYFEKLKEKSDE